MGYAEQLFWWTTTICLLLLTAGCVRVLWRWGSASTRRASAPPSQEATPNFALRSEVAQLREEVDSLCSTLEKNSTTVKRLSSRAGMREHRERNQPGSPPPVGTAKADLLRYYGMSGKVGPAFAQAQMSMFPATREESTEH